MIDDWLLFGIWPYPRYITIVIRRRRRNDEKVLSTYIQFRLGSVRFLPDATATMIYFPFWSPIILETQKILFTADKSNCFSNRKRKKNSIKCFCFSAYKKTAHTITQQSSAKVLSMLRQWINVIRYVHIAFRVFFLSLSFRSQWRFARVTFYNGATVKIRL